MAAFGSMMRLRTKHVLVVVVVVAVWGLYISQQRVISLPFVTRTIEQADVHAVGHVVNHGQLADTSESHTVLLAGQNIVNVDMVESNQMQRGYAIGGEGGKGTLFITCLKLFVHAYLDHEALRVHALHYVYYE